MKLRKSRRDQPGRRGSWRATTLLLGMAILPTQPDSISVLPRQVGIVTIVPLQPFPSLRQSDVSSSHAPATTQLDPNAIIPFDPSMSSLPGLPSSDFAAMGVPSENGADAQAIDGGSAPAPLSVYAAAAKLAAQKGECAQLTETPAPAGSYWNSHAGSAMPSLLAASKSIAAVTPASGMPTQLSALGSSGVWCRPGPMPIEDSSPLASRTFWAPVLILIFGLIVFWITRGFALPR
jgi:hypothetical protein